MFSFSVVLSIRFRPIYGEFPLVRVTFRDEYRQTIAGVLLSIENPLLVV